MLNIHAVSSLKDNYIWVLCKGADAIAVDPGQAEPFIAFLCEKKLSLRAILVTHRHRDHMDGIPQLQALYRVPVWGPIGLNGISNPVHESIVFDILGEPCRVMSLPGHTREHLAFLIADSLFCGDTLFGAGCGRILDGGNGKDLFISLMRIAALPDHTRLFPAHEYTLSNLQFAAMVEPSNLAIQNRLIRDKMRRDAGQPTLPTSVGEEKKTNPFLRCTAPQIQARVAQYDPSATDTLSTFLALRHWKDHFTPSP